MIKEVRDYIKAQIAKVDSDLVENKSAFYRGDIGETVIDNSFHINLNSFSGDQRSDTRESTINAELSLFGHGFREEVENYDELFEKAVCISDNITSLKNINLEGFIADVSPIGSIEAENLDTDENGFRIVSSYTIRLAYFTED